ncbi:MAG: hypothetical protein FD174_1973 [Geobacteraceae bacterium]|nr:MAG: hypothetical protein FD174_1973 [Geobacteraceae bacterium]
MNFPGKGIPLDIIKGSIATLTLFLAYISFPLVGLLPGVFAPLPCMYYTLKSGKLVGSAIVAIVAVVLAIVVDPETTALYLLQCGIISLSLPLFLAKGRGAARAIAYAVTLNIAVILVLAAVYGLSQGVDLDRQVLKGVETSISQTTLLYEKKGLKGDELKLLQQGMKQAGVVIARIYPALLVVSFGIIAGFNLLVLKRVSARLPEPLPVGDFKLFKNPEQLVWVVIAAGFAMLIDNTGVARAALNVLVVTLFMYFLQGMAVVIHFFTRLAVPTFVRVIFYILLIAQPYMTVAVAALGIFDLWGNFRTPKQRENL